MEGGRLRGKEEGLEGKRKTERDRGIYGTTEGTWKGSRRGRQGS